MRIRGCRLKEKTQDRLSELFVGGVTARSAADLAHVNRKTAAYFFHRLRQIIARQLEDSLPVEGLVEVDESYYGGVRKGKRGAAGKIPVFGILKRGGKVHTVMIPDVRKDTLLPIIRRKVFRIQLSIPTLIAPMTSSTSPSSTTTGSTTQTPMFSIATITSTESRTSGARPMPPLLADTRRAILRRYWEEIKGLSFYQELYDFSASPWVRPGGERSAGHAYTSVRHTATEPLPWTKLGGNGTPAPEQKSDAGKHGLHYRHQAA